MPSFFLYLMIFILGLVAGSFLNCVIYRLENNLSFLKGRSFCPHCRRQLGFWDLIPIFSFLFLKGRCRYCHETISWQYPLVEIATGLVFLLFFHSSFSIFYFLLSAFLIVIFVYDLKHLLIPDGVIYPAIGLALVYDFLNLGFLGMANFLIAALSAAAFFLAVVLISRGKWMGVGDIKLGFLMGLILGWPVVFVALFLAFLSGAIIGVGLMISGRKSLKSEVPFGPFLVAGTLATLFWGEALINWYVKIFYPY